MNEISVIEPITSTSLATVETLVPENVFAPGGVAAILTALKTEVRAQAAGLDISTERGRKQIASLAYKVAQSKTALDKMGKDLTAEWQKQTNLVNEDRRAIRSDLDALKDEVRKPLDDYEAADAERVKAHEAALMEIEILASVDGRTAEQINEHIWKVPAIDGRAWQEFNTRAERVIAITLERLKVAHAAAVEREAAEAEAERVRQAEVDRIAAENEAKRIQREKEIADNARAVAIMEAEQKAERERQTAQRADYHRRMLQHVKNCGFGFIDEQPQPIGILQHELTTKIKYDAENFGDLLPEALAARDEALKTIQRSIDESNRRQEQQEAAAEALAQAERDKREAEERRQQAERQQRAELTRVIEWMKERPAINHDWEIAHQISHLDSNLIRLSELIGEYDWQDVADEAIAARDAATDRVTEQRDKLVARQAEIEEGRRQHEADEATRRQQEAATAATLAEQKRAAAQKAEEQRQTDRRATNVALQRKVNREILTDIGQVLANACGLSHGQSEPIAKAIIEAIAKGAVRHTSIKY